MNLRRGAAGLAVVLAGVAASTGIAVTPAAAQSGEYWLSQLQLSKVWQITRGAGVTVAVVDSGVPAVANLGSRLLTGVDLATGGPNGHGDIGEKTPAGPTSHGQQMAEYIAGDGTDGLTRGIAPAAKILPVKIGVSSATESTSSNSAAGIRWAVDHGAKVINASYGGHATCVPEEGDAIKYAYDHDVIVVAAAGNNPGPVSTPADCPGALAAAGVDANAAVWSKSAYGPEVDVANFATDTPGTSLTGEPVIGDGTSAATAFTAGEIALLRAKFPQDSARAIVTRMLRGIDPLSTKARGTFVSDHVGYGLPMPLAELTATVPANAPNPIYDKWARELGPPTFPKTKVPTRRESGARVAPLTATPPPEATSGGGARSDSTTIAFGVGAVAIVLIAALTGALTRPSRRHPARGPAGTPAPYPPYSPPAPYPAPSWAPLPPAPAPHLPRPSPAPRPAAPEPYPLPAPARPRPGNPGPPSG